MNRKSLFYCLVILGLILCLAGAFSPFHELWHVIFSTFNWTKATITDWNHTTISPPTPSVIVGGYWGEFVGYIIICWIFAGIRLWPIIGLPFGAMHATMIKAGYSHDYTVLLPRYIGWDATYLTIFKWYVITIIILGIGWIILAAHIRSQHVFQTQDG